jgi:hypothetical protein
MLLLIPTLISTYIYIPYENAYADSPSFTRQEITDNLHDEIRLNGCKPLLANLTNVGYRYSLDYSSDIDSINYFSNGKTLNATIWLNGPIQDLPDFGDGKNSNETILRICNAAREELPMLAHSRVVYGMLINTDSNNATGKGGADYQIELQWDNAIKKMDQILH